MKVVLVCAVCMFVACSEDDGARHLPDAPMQPGNFELVVTKDGNGSGTVSSTPAGIACGDTCTASFAEGTMVTLTAQAADDSQFTGWSGACSGEVDTCDITLAAAANVTATFAKKTYTVTFTKAGPGTGSIDGDGVACTSSCTKTVEHGTMLTLTATPTNLSVFAGWGGACVNPTGPCTVTVTSDTSIAASFVLDNFSLVVTPAGNGSGTVTSNPTGITCGTTCSHTYTANQTVTLTAAPATSSTFAGWSGGGCTGTGTCTVTIDGSKTVTPTFTLKTFALTVTKVGSGTVTSNPAGINCGATCTKLFNYSTTPVTLTATPANGYIFSGFSGACTGMTCSVTMTAARNVTATFTQVHTLTVSKPGDGVGTVTGTASNGASINCGSGAGCVLTGTPGTTITLTATASTGVDATQSTFLGWSGGGCANTGTCSVTLNGDVTITANFKLDPNIMFVTSKVFRGDFGGVGVADGFCKDLASGAGRKGNYRAYLSYRIDATTTANAPDRFPASGWVMPNGKQVMNDIAQLHKGTILNAPRFSESGIDITQFGSTNVWTGTSSVGTYSGFACEVAQGATSSWNTQFGIEGTYGDATATDALVVNKEHLRCPNSFHLYCLGIDRKATLP